jgi:hypothetical protein
LLPRRFFFTSGLVFCRGSRGFAGVGSLCGCCQTVAAATQSIEAFCCAAACDCGLEAHAHPRVHNLCQQLHVQLGGSFWWCVVCLFQASAVDVCSCVPLEMCACAQVFWLVPYLPCVSQHIPSGTHRPGLVGCCLEVACCVYPCFPRAPPPQHPTARFLSSFQPLDTLPFAAWLGRGPGSSPFSGQSAAALQGCKDKACSQAGPSSI